MLVQLSSEGGLPETAEQPGRATIHDGSSDCQPFKKKKHSFIFLELCDFYIDRAVAWQPMFPSIS